MGATGRYFETSGKYSIREQNTNLNGLSSYNHHFIKKNQVYSLGKLNRKELYNTFYENLKVTREF